MTGIYRNTGGSGKRGQFGNSDAVIMADHNVNNTGHCPTFEPFEPCGTLHNGCNMPFIDGNRLYADGHVLSADYPARRLDPEAVEADLQRA